jgi:prepilin-type N-terminal cleavage/methylation domain-containing protein
VGAGFTLIEVLLAVGILGFVSFLFVSSAADLFRSSELRPEDVFWQGVTASRQLALDSNRVVTLRYSADKRSLVWSAGADPVRSLAFPGRQLEFLPIAEQATVLLGGQLTETGSIKAVRFYPDGGCDAFRAQLTDATGRRTLLAIDPWTCAPMLTAPAK